MQWTRLPANHGPDLVPGSNILARYRFYSEAEAAERGDGYREIGTNLGSVLVCWRDTSVSTWTEFCPVSFPCIHNDFSLAPESFPPSTSVCSSLASVCLINLKLL